MRVFLKSSLIIASLFFVSCKAEKGSSFLDQTDPKKISKFGKAVDISLKEFESFKEQLQQSSLDYRKQLIGNPTLIESSQAAKQISLWNTESPMVITDFRNFDVTCVENYKNESFKKFDGLLKIKRNRYQGGEGHLADFLREAKAFLVRAIFINSSGRWPESFSVLNYYSEDPALLTVNTIGRRVEDLSELAFLASNTLSYQDKKDMNTGIYMSPLESGKLYIYMFGNNSTFGCSASLVPY